jgi:hypothetical protein
MTIPSKPVIFRLRLRVLKPEPDEGIRRLRLALKHLLRRFGLRCVEIIREQDAVKGRRR